MKECLLTEFGARIKKLRQDRQLTQNDLANKSGLHKNYIGMIERGERNPSLLNIGLISRAMDISLSEMMNF